MTNEAKRAESFVHALGSFSNLVADTGTNDSDVGGLVPLPHQQSSDAVVGGHRDVELGEEPLREQPKPSVPEPRISKSVSFDLDDTISDEFYLKRDESQTFLEASPAQDHNLRTQRRNDSVKMAMGRTKRRRHNLFKPFASPKNMLRRRRRSTSENGNHEQSPTNNRDLRSQNLLERRSSDEFSSSSSSFRYSKNNLAQQHRLRVSTRKMMDAQYNLTTDHGQNSPARRIMGSLGIGLEYDDANGSRSLTFCGMSFDLMVTEALHWSFRSSFAAVFLCSWVAFMVMCLIFALLIWAIGHGRPTCLGGVDGDSNDFMDAFALSWTTFSTVGYGLVYSGISAGESDIKKCTGITILVSLEAFVGVLFASLVGAILFVKVARIQSLAQIKFSDAILVRYGQGVKVEEEFAAQKLQGTRQSTQHQSPQNEDSDEWDDEYEEDERIPCPVLEFQVVNLLNGYPTGEIMDASINVVASIDAEQACHTVRNASKKKRKKKGKKVPSRSFSPKKETGPAVHLQHQQSDLSAILNSFAEEEKRMHQLHEEESGGLVPHRIFSRLEIETQDHPFFKRIWTIRHVLDGSSPLLKTAARNLVRACGDYWPKELNNARCVRDAIQFDQLLISFSGTSNADANTVYFQKVYEFGAVNVGYTFVNMLYKANDKHHRYNESICVDTHLINDVTEQAGGGGEKLFQKRQNSHERLTDMIML